MTRPVVDTPRVPGPPRVVGRPTPRPPSALHVIAAERDQARALAADLAARLKVAEANRDAIADRLQTCRVLVEGTRFQLLRGEHDMAVRTLNAIRRHTQ